MAFAEMIKDIKLNIKNYKSFGSDEQGFDGIEPMNILVGRNNSGKSALLDLIEFSCGNYKFSPGTNNRSGTALVTLETLISEDAIASIFRPDTSGGDIGMNHFEYGKRYVGRRIKVALTNENVPALIGIDYGDLPAGPLGRFQAVAGRIKSPFSGKSFKRLGADRDVTAEVDVNAVTIKYNGEGFTNIIQRFINKSSLPNDLVERRLLEELNKIFSPDAAFKNVRVRQHEHGAWEVYLEEQDKGAIALSHSGSGLKTVLLVLGFLILLPVIEGKPLSEYVFAFEELENNLHPSLQRRLAKYVYDSAIENDFIVFLTTHSSAVIDMFSHNDRAQIVHVTHNESVAKARRVTTYVENSGILDDLDVRASDLLQANGIVWVEGPSDRLYFNRWINLISNGELEEGVHYQCVFYGGRLLAHISGAQPFDGVDQEKAVRIFRVNRNAIVLIDSDKAHDSDEINQTKQRVVSEVEALNGLAWVTAGREVEHYVPSEVMRRLFPKGSFSLGPFDEFGHALETCQPGEGRKFERNKVLFAERVIPLLEKADLLGALDLENRVIEASKVIARWNRIKPSWLT